MHAACYHVYLAVNCVGSEIGKDVRYRTTAFSYKIAVAPGFLKWLTLKAEHPNPATAGTKMLAGT